MLGTGILLSIAMEDNTMRGSKFSLVAALALCGLLVIGAPARASTFTEYLYDCGANVCASGSGTISLTGLTSEGGSTFAPQISPGAGILTSGSGDIVLEYGVISGPYSFGSGGDTDASSGSGSNVGIYGVGYSTPNSPAILVPTGYVSGTSLTSSAVFDTTTLVALGVTLGTYTWTWDGGANSFTIEAGIAPTPLPAALPLFVTGLGAMGLFGWHRKRKTLAAV
jgi:hypothetical protein